MEAFRLDGQTALITGGGTGLGFAIARCYVAAGAKVVLAGRRGDVLEEACKRMGSNAHGVVYDVTDWQGAPGLIARAEEVAGPLSILVNNAGLHLKKPALDTTEEELLNVFHTHVTGAFALTRAAARGMVERGRGSVIFMSSMSAYMGLPLVIAYTTAKTAYLGMVRGLAAEFAESGVRVNAIAPGWIQSDMLDQALSGDPARREKILGRIMTHKFGDPDDIGWAATYLASPAAGYVTGVCLPIDGGASVGF